MESGSVPLLGYEPKRMNRPLLVFASLSAALAVCFLLGTMSLNMHERRYNSLLVKPQIQRTTMLCEGHFMDTGKRIWRTRFFSVYDSSYSDGDS
jgi:hypothetical protein